MIDQRTPVAPDFSAFLDLRLAERRAAKQEYYGRHDGWRASSLGHCMRRQYLSRAGVPELKPLDAETLRTFAWGDFIEDWVVGEYRDAGLLIAEQVKLEDKERNLSGTIDLIIGGDYEGVHYPVTVKEVKSIKATRLKYLYDEGPDPRHMYQLAAYRLMMTQLGSQDHLADNLTADEIEDWRVLYVGKDTAHPVEYGLTDKWVRRANQRVDDLNGYWEREEVPPCTCLDEYMNKKSGKSLGPRFCAYADYGDQTPDKEKDPLTCCGREIGAHAPEGGKV